MIEDKTDKYYNCDIDLVADRLQVIKSKKFYECRLFIDFIGAKKFKNCLFDHCDFIWTDTINWAKLENPIIDDCIFQDCTYNQTSFDKDGIMEELSKVCSFEIEGFEL